MLLPILTFMSILRAVNLARCVCRSPAEILKSQELQTGAAFDELGGAAHAPVFFTDKSTGAHAMVVQVSETVCCVCAGLTP
jgi:hypothetical protein